MFKNKVGLEAEFFVTNKKEELVFPADYGFETDDFVILGEIRAEPATSRAETVANFWKVYYEALENAKANDLNISFGHDNEGYSEVKPDFYAKILRLVGVKTIAKCKNIYDTDLLTLSDAKIKKGKVVSNYLSIGLHVHFSSQNIEKRHWEYNNTPYELVNVPLKLSGKSVFNLELYKRGIQSTASKDFEVGISRITNPVIKHFVKEMDENLLKKYKQCVNLKYRNPGFYELKHYGFEYRSLPFNEDTYHGIYEITDFAFSLLEDL